MSTVDNTSKPLSYQEWASSVRNTTEGANESGYFLYLKNWHVKKGQSFNQPQYNNREDYIQLIKDLNVLLGDKKTDIFNQDIDFNNEEDLILSIPFFAKKLKQIAKILNLKRESIKRAKNRYAINGTNFGLEKLLSEYILKTFTNKNGLVTQLPVASIQSYLPELSSVKNDFYLEIEELYDTNNHFDKDPSLDYSSYTDSSSLSELYFTQLSGSVEITEKDVINFLKSNFMSQAGDSSVFSLFQEYNEVINNSTEDLISYNTKIWNNYKYANVKYMGEKVYGLSAIRVEDLNEPDQILDINLSSGSNWFIWPSGFQILNESTYNNFYEPININESSLISSGATPGTTLENSDLIFTDKNGVIEGAWLSGPRLVESKVDTSISLKGKEITEFLFPYVGFDIESRGLSFKGFSFKERDQKLFKNLNKNVQDLLLTSYYTETLPLSTSLPIYLNHSNLIDQGAYAAKYSNEADNIFKAEAQQILGPAFYDAEGLLSDSAYAFKFDRTDIFVKQGFNQIIWPIESFEKLINISLFPKENTCLPVKISDINPGQTSIGAVAGKDFATSDVVYKLNRRTDDTDVEEAAWLGSSSIQELDTTKEIYPIYDKPYIKCAYCLEGPIQSQLSFIVNPGNRVSFVWCGADTFADNVFRYVEHEQNCIYGQTYPHEYYNNPDFVNPEPLTDLNHWSKCSCRAKHYSPIGHRGHKLTDYMGMTDFLYADPYDLGPNFTLGTWVDTRGYTYKDSPQFSFFQLRTGVNHDSPVGMGLGRWKTSGLAAGESNDRMVLKTGRRYTYFRTALRKDAIVSATTSDFAPYFVSKFPYPKPTQSYLCENSTPVDLVILLDYSRSQSYDFRDIKLALTKITTELLSKDNVQISLIGFDSSTFVVNYLTNIEYELAVGLTNLEQRNDYPQYTTNIYNALRMAWQILTTSIPEFNNNVSGSPEIKTLCSNLKAAIINSTANGRKLNSPQLNASKKILLISDGVETGGSDFTLVMAKALKEGGKDPVFGGVISGGVEITTVSLGELSIRNNVVETIASGGKHFDLHRYKTSGDGDYDTFIHHLCRSLFNCGYIWPMWKKAIKTSDGLWQGLDEPSPMVLKPGDFLKFNHQSSVQYQVSNTGNIISVPSTDFTWNVKLDGWDYYNNTFNLLNVGEEYGAKPFWAKVPIKGVPLGGSITFKSDYVPVHQPEASKMVLKNGDFIRYNRRGLKNLNWTQPVDLEITVQETRWNKILFPKVLSNLKDFIKTDKTNRILIATHEPSEITLESFKEYKPALYYYYGVDNFNYIQNLYRKNRCSQSFISVNSAVEIDPLEPHSNLSNTFFPTIARTSFPQLTKSERDLGGYFLPDKIGVSFYKGKGYSYTLNLDALSAIDAKGQDRVFLDPQKYGARNRGLTKNDQLSPIKLSFLDNKWVVEPYGSGEKSGVILGTRENQKFTPYQSTYEILGENHHGLARQEDVFQFWDFDLNSENLKWNKQNSKTTYNKDLESESYFDRAERLLVNKGSQTQWRTDIFGNDYGLYKHLPQDSIDPIIYSEKVGVTITDFSASKNVKVGEFFLLFVKATGSEPLSYQWYKNNVPITGANNSTYVVYNANAGDVGIYFCEVRNVINKTRSSTLAVNVLIVTS